MFYYSCNEGFLQVDISLLLPMLSGPLYSSLLFLFLVFIEDIGMMILLQKNDATKQKFFIKTIILSIVVGK